MSGKPVTSPTMSGKADTSAAKGDETAKKRQFVTKAEEEGAVGATGRKPPVGYLITIIHLVKGYVGTGIFAMGEAFKFSGHTLGIGLLAIIAIMNLHCQHILLKCAAKVAEAEEEEVRPSFSETVQYTMELSSIAWVKRNAEKFGFATTVFLLIAELGFCCVYFVFISEHLIEIFSDYTTFFTSIHDPKSKHIMLAIILIPMWISTFLGNLKLLMPLSLISNVLIWLGIILIMYFTISGPSASDRQYISNGTEIHRYFGTAFFAFEGITFIVPLRNEMKHPEQFISLFGVLNVGMTFVVSLYCMVGFLAYWKYGQKVESSVFLNLPKHEILSQVTQALICGGVLFTFTLHQYIPFEISYPLFHRKYGPFKHEILAKCIYRTVPVLITYFLANVVPFLGLFISIVGATTGAMLAIIIPPTLELISYYGELHVMIVIKDYFIVTVGVIVLIFGTSLSLVDLVKEFMKYNDKKH